MDNVKIRKVKNGYIAVIDHHDMGTTGDESVFNSLPDLFGWLKDNFEPEKPKDDDIPY